MAKMGVGNTHENVKTLRVIFWVTSKFEVRLNIIVIAEAPNIKVHDKLYPPQKH